MAKTPLYYSIYKTLVLDIQSGKYPIGTNLPTDKNLVELFNVSQITIKKAMDLLSQNGYISRKPRKGTTVISENPITPSTINNSHILFGLILPSFSDAFGSVIIKRILTTTTDRVNFIVKISSGRPELEDQALSELEGSGAQGIILLPISSKYASTKLLELVTKNFPIVIIDRSMADLPISSIKTNNSDAAKFATNYLITKGHTKIGLIASDNQVTAIDERISGFVAAHTENAITLSRQQIMTTIDSVVPSSTQSPANDINQIINFFINNSDLTAVIASEYNIALLIQQSLKILHKRIPEDISIICFDESANSSFIPNSFMFTHIEQNEKEMGEIAVDLLLKEHADHHFFKKINLAAKFIEGNTVADRS
ncbi:GntR family transcriptional regulator [Lapidilactobacillus bayanensis]|uniref:GntR family transcriptional regulator n=1 Tax=Lapidilactobacillus bayanensis TaxID=2485998 RepID=UPI0013DE70CA|nr:GntR family transcriptional regulator [Lapidilactobacillus bayanensis]